MKINCAIADDLLPLYVDDSCSEDKMRRLLLAHEDYEEAFAGKVVPPETVCGDDAKETAS